MTTIETKETEKTVKRVIKSPLKPRTKRTPLSKQKRIGIRQEKGYHYHLVNDIGDRISAFHEAGYDLVEAEAREGEKASQDSSQLGKYASQSVGNGVTAYYMRTPDKYYREDQLTKQVEIDKTDQIIGMDKIDGRVRRGSVEIDYGSLDSK